MVLEIFDGQVRARPLASFRNGTAATSGMSTAPAK